MQEKHQPTLYTLYLCILSSYILVLHCSLEPAHLLIRLPAAVLEVAFHRCSVPCTSLEDTEKLCPTAQSKLLVSCGPLPSPRVDSPLPVTASLLVLRPLMRPGHAGSNYSRRPTMPVDQRTWTGRGNFSSCVSHSHPCIPAVYATHKATGLLHTVYTRILGIRSSYQQGNILLYTGNGDQQYQAPKPHITCHKGR